MNDAPLLVLTTGGTIDKRYFDALSACQVADTVVARLLEIARVTLPFEIVELSRKDSLDFYDGDRAALTAATRAASSSRTAPTR